MGNEQVLFIRRQFGTNHLAYVTSWPHSLQIGCGVVGGAYAKAYVHHGFRYVVV